MAEVATKPKPNGQIAAAMAPGMHLEKYIGETTNLRGIPTILFIDNVENFMKEKDTSVEHTIGVFSEMLQKYKLMETSLTRQAASLKLKLPEIETTLDLVKLLKMKSENEEELIANYPLSEVVHARAKVNCNGTVCLWLGANVMVEYTYAEALAMLEKNESDAIEKQKETADDLTHLKDQITTLEVNMARVFNYNVKVKRGSAPIAVN